jgi:hypothetical protein
VSATLIAALAATPLAAQNSTMPPAQPPAVPVQPPTTPPGSSTTPPTVQPTPPPDVAPPPATNDTDTTPAPAPPPPPAPISIDPDAAYPNGFADPPDPFANDLSQARRESRGFPWGLLGRLGLLGLIPLFRRGGGRTRTV